MEEEVRRERQRAEYMARAAAWQLEKEEAEEAKVVFFTCTLQIMKLVVVEHCSASPAPVICFVAAEVITPTGECLSAHLVA